MSGTSFSSLSAQAEHGACGGRGDNTFPLLTLLWVEIQRPSFQGTCVITVSYHTAIGPSGTQFPLVYSGGVGLGGPWRLCSINVVRWAVILTLTGSVSEAGPRPALGCVHVQGGVARESL